MSGRVLLDTNIIIALFAGDSSVPVGLERVREVFVPTIALGELYFGARKSTQVERNLARIEELSVNSMILTCNMDTAGEYGLIKDKLYKKGRPIPENDIWIAAIALQYDLILVTRDSHFGEIEDLKQEVW